MTTKAVTSNSSSWLVGACTLITLAYGASGCIEDSDCGICDPDNLVLESISGVNYASRKIHLIDPECDGSDCPAPFNSGSYFIEEIGPCEQTVQALNSPRGVEEFCKLSPLVTAFGIEFVFNNLLDPTSVELVRKRPDNPQLFEVYDWKHQILDIQGPITRYNGDFRKGGADEADKISRLINLSCIDNLRDEGRTFGHEDYEDPATNPCNAVGPNGLPRKLRESGTITSYPGRWTVGGQSCDTPEEGPDTCCSRCDYLLSTQVAKFGLTAAGDEDSTLTDLRQNGLLRNPNRGSAIVCDPSGDVFTQCADFVPWAGRSEQEVEYEYFWDCNPATDAGCQPQSFNLPYYDKLRETHPNLRPAWLERRNAACSSTAECRDPNIHGLPGSDCVGITADGLACDPAVDPEGCTNGRCVAEWFVTCRSNPDTFGDADPSTPETDGYCTDQRFADRGAAACLRSRGNNTVAGQPGTFDALCDENGNCSIAPGGTRLAFCDHNEDGTIIASECCQDTLQTELGVGPISSCDPFYQDLDPVTIYDRNATLPTQTKSCICPSGGTLGSISKSDGCYNAIRSGCFDPEEVRANGDSAPPRPERAGQYAVKFVSRVGGTIYDPAIKGFEWRTADIGSVPRADIESCAETRGLIDERNIEDGYRANDSFAPDRIEDFDRSMCSASEYTIRFKTPEDGGQFVKDKRDNTLAGKASYTFTTPDFHVEPGSGFPSDNLRIGACDSFSLRFSNKYDMSPENLSKLEIWQLKPDDPNDPNDDLPWNERFDVRVAGGLNCATTEEDLANGVGSVPCLTVDVGNQLIGEVSVEIDPTEFGSFLQPGVRYRLWAPGLSSRDQMLTNPELYAAAFWDACGMPLITSGGTSEPDFLYDFTVDEPKCEEDQDLDNVNLSCDNAPDFFNPDQGDIDRDGFGDVVDRCPTLAGSSDDTADSDDDGIGNECDNCRQAPRNYNRDEAAPLGYMVVRNIPFQEDSDQDGIGDVCDNCVLTANCDQYSSNNPWELGDPIAYDDNVLCQLDANNDMVGDACAGIAPADFAAGAIGIGSEDDFDQDGLPNSIDACPRQPMARTAAEQLSCQSDADCPTGRKCEVDYNLCDHSDSDNDGVGDICDTCPFNENPLQIADGAMQEGDDPDGDFVGNACETHPSCENRVDPRPFSFYEVASNGYCCTVALFEDSDGNLQLNLPPRDDGIAQLPAPLLDPDGLPVRVNCPATADGVECRQLNSSVANTRGILTPPEGCEEALNGLDPRENPKLTLADVGGDTEALWDRICLLPQFDQDYDGLGDRCDLCEFDFDPENRPYQDANGRLWPNDGFYCNGIYSAENKPACAGQDGGEPDPTGGNETGGTGDETGGTGGSESGSGG